jgi:hypothetical protein
MYIVYASTSNSLYIRLVLFHCGRHTQAPLPMFLYSAAKIRGLCNLNIDQEEGRPRA